MKWFQTDYRLWGQIFAVLILPPLVLVSAMAADDLRTAHSIDLSFVVGGLFVAWMAAVSWLAQALTLMSGWRSPPRQTDPQAVDYDEWPPVP